MISCLVVDDEPLELEIMEDFISKVPFLDLKGLCENAISAGELLKKQPVDLLFLDIKMPDMSGIDFLKSLHKPPMVIFTTAHEEYALEGYNLKVLDYLLKPIAFERFLVAANRAYEQLQEKKDNHKGAYHDKDYIFIRADYKIIKLNFDDIIFLEGLKDYTKIYTREKTILTLKNLGAFESLLPQDNFIRVHRSYIVSARKINTISKNRIMIDTHSIPISNSYKEILFDQLHIQP